MIKDAELTPARVQKLLAYLDAIGETDLAMINELLIECGKDTGTLAWALNWADKVLAEKKQPEQSLITCRHCINFRCFNAHGGGGGTCDAGVSPPGSFWWSETRHDCGEFI